MPSDISQVSIDFAAIHGASQFLGFVIAGIVLWRTRVAGRLFPLSRRGLVLTTLILLVANNWLAGFGRVQPGARGIVLRFGAPTNLVLGEGLYAVVPFADRVVEVNTQINTIHFDRAQGTCLDLEPVFADFSLAFHVEPARAIDVYRTLRTDYAARIVRPAVLDAWKATVAHYNASDLIAKRKSVQTALRSEIAGRIAPFGLTLDSVSTDRFNFAYAYAQAAQLKVASVQRTLQAQQELQRIKFESQQGVIRARSEVEALKLQRNIPIGQLMHMRQLDLQRRAIDKWDGRLPQATSGTPFLGNTLAPKPD